MLFVMLWHHPLSKTSPPSGCIGRLNTSCIMERMRQPSFVPT
nr:MAG TPA: hypothetical protein [Caudoviricetes sp.]DAY36858.1 MAG TPA: hypothetical protein [Caudoviricetes sp.]